MAAGRFPAHLIKTLKLWDLADGRCLRSLEGHTSYVNSVALSPDGRFALSGSDDRTLKLWALPTERMADSQWQLADLCSYGKWATAQKALSGWRSSCQDNLKTKRFVAALSLFAASASRSSVDLEPGQSCHMPRFARHREPGGAASGVVDAYPPRAYF